MPNPYQSPHTSDVATAQLNTAKPIRRYLKWYRLIAWLYPLLMVASLYVTWLVAWVVLGKMPRPNLDDPKYIAWQVDIPLAITGFLLIAMPGAATVGLMLECIVGKKPFTRRIANCLLLAGLWTLAICFLRWDPLNVVEWFFD